LTRQLWTPRNNKELAKKDEEMEMESYFPPLKAISAKEQEVRNAMCIEGHLNKTLAAMMRSNSPDETFNILGALVNKAIELSFAALADSPAPDVRPSEMELRNEIAELHACLDMVVDENSTVAPSAPQITDQYILQRAEHHMFAEDQKGALTEYPESGRQIIALVREFIGRPSVPVSDEQILRFICDHTGKRINLPNFTLDELMDFARDLLNHQSAQQ
jgi:hypothetical protein